MKLFEITCLFILTMSCSGKSNHLRGLVNDEPQRRIANPVYFRTNSTAVLGAPNLNAAVGNPLKGLAGGARWAPLPLPDSVPLSIEFYNLGVSLLRTNARLPQREQE